MKNIIYITILITLLSCSKVFREIHADGSLKSKGAYKNNLKHGEWISIDNKGDTAFIYNFKKGELNGFAKYYSEGKNFKYKNISRPDNFNTSTSIRKENMLIITNFKNNEFHGLFKLFYANGKLKEKGNFKKGVEQGLFEEYHDNGERSVINNYIDGKLNGNWKQFYSTGKLREERTFINGDMLFSTEYEWYDNGNLEMSASYSGEYGKKIPHGKHTNSYENGQIQKISFYENGKANGEWKGFYPSGKIKFIIIYKNQKFITYTQYEEDGTIKNK